MIVAVKYLKHAMGCGLLDLIDVSVLPPFVTDMTGKTASKRHMGSR